MSVIVDIAETVAAELNTPGAPTFGAPPAALAAKRAYRPDFDLAELKDLRVTVVPKGIELSTAGRGLAQSDVQIDVAVQKKFSEDTGREQAEIDALMALVEQIADFLRSRRLTGYSDAAWVHCENVPIYSPEHLAEKRVFTSVLTLTYRVLK